MRSGKEDEVLKNADIVVENNRIKSVGAKGSVPAGAKVFDVSGKTIAPASSIRMPTGRKSGAAFWTRKTGRSSRIWLSV